MCVGVSGCEGCVVNVFVFRYDLYDVEISAETSLQMPQGAVYAMEGFFYVTVSVEEVLFEGGRSIR